MAVCGDEGGRPCCGTAGDAARTEGIRGHAGQVGSQRCTRHRATDAAGMVPAGALQIDECARDPIAADGAQAGAIEASRRREQPARDPSRFWPEGWQDHWTEVRGTDRGTGGRRPASADDRQGPAGSASGAADRVHSLREADPQDGTVRAAGAAADVVPAVGPIVALTYSSAIDDPARFKSSKQTGAHFGLTPKKPGREGRYVPLRETIRGFREILDGKHDDLPESAFMMVGTIEEVQEQAARIAKSD